MFFERFFGALGFGVPGLEGVEFPCPTTATSNVFNY